MEFYHEVFYWELKNTFELQCVIKTDATKKPRQNHGHLTLIGGFIGTEWWLILSMICHNLLRCYFDMIQLCTCWQFILSTLLQEHQLHMFLNLIGMSLDYPFEQSKYYYCSAWISERLCPSSSSENLFTLSWKNYLYKRLMT